MGEHLKSIGKSIKITENNNEYYDWLTKNKERKIRIMTLEDIKNAGYRVFGAYGVDHRDFSHMWQIYDGYAYHGIIEVDGKKKFFRVTLIEDCPLYNVRIQIKTIDDLKAAIKEYFPVDSTDTHYYDMYNVQMRDSCRVESFVYGIIKEYGFKSDGYSYSLNDVEVSFTRQIGNKKNLVLVVDTKNFKFRVYFGVFSWSEADFKMWDIESVKNALSQVIMVPVLTEVGPGFDLLVSMPASSKTAEINSVDGGLLSAFGAKPDDIRTKLESAKANIEKLLANI